MSSDFESYEQDFAVLTAEITGRIGKVPKLVGDDKKQMVANVEKQLEEARELLEQMELEVREIPPQSRGMYSSRMRSYKQEMGKLEADFFIPVRHDYSGVSLDAAVPKLQLWGSCTDQAPVLQRLWSWLYLVVRSGVADHALRLSGLTKVLGPLTEEFLTSKTVFLRAGAVFSLHLPMHRYVV
ncbi:vesicle transport through interaction with t-SNAREs homolog 1A isoform X5 [Columba livia]|uniref:vesicle transport through interaction with t-SNAREs homolog 1A isoform X5 n=1 Tax=Columba livia TaxID=8932 RepID=UPI000A39F4B5|nr:vesicle transport through interaction with t-SNAREs homolog 1A isoform X6 [Columba livia]